MHGVCYGRRIVSESIVDFGFFWVMILNLYSSTSSVRLDDHFMYIYTLYHDICLKAYNQIKGLVRQEHSMGLETGSGRGGRVNDDANFLGSLEPEPGPSQNYIFST